MNFENKNITYYEILLRKNGTKGHLFWKEHWYSFCSGHQKYDEDCKICNIGSWCNVWNIKFNAVVFKFFPSLWIWYKNRPSSKTLKEILKQFPQSKQD